MTEDLLQRGLKITNMMDRLKIYDLIQKLKHTQNDNNNKKPKTKELQILDLEKAPPMKKKRKRKKIINDIDDKMNNNNNNNANNKYIGATANFLKLSNEHSRENNKTSSELLMDKMKENNKKRKLNEINNGKQHKIEWKYDENKKYNDLNINLNDCILFKWQFTKNVWQFMNKKAFEENNFNTFVCEQLCASNHKQYLWKANKCGIYYFGCQIANCSKTGNMKIKVIVTSKNDDQNQNKKQRID